MTDTTNITADFQSTLTSPVDPKQLMTNLANVFRDTRLSNQMRPSTTVGLTNKK